MSSENLAEFLILDFLLGAVLVGLGPVMDFSGILGIHDAFYLPPRSPIII